MLPARVRRPQLQFEKGLPDTDDEGMVGRREERGGEGEGDDGDEGEEGSGDGGEGAERKQG